MTHRFILGVIIKFWHMKQFNGFICVSKSPKWLKLFKGYAKLVLVSGQNK